MQQVPFDEQGVTAKVNELYALSDSQLALQADEIRTNFDQWVTANFQLTNDQASYLSSMSASAKGKIADFTSDAVRWRLPIDSGKEGSGPITSKRFRLSCDFQIESFPGQPDVTTGGLHFLSDYGI